MRSHRSLRTSLVAQVLLNGLTLGTSATYRKNLEVRAPTPEQLAHRERDDWNKQVEAKKAAKRASKDEQVGAERKAP